MRFEKVWVHRQGGLGGRSMMTLVDSQIPCSQDPQILQGSGGRKEKVVIKLEDEELTIAEKTVVKRKDGNDRGQWLNGCRRLTGTCWKREKKESCKDTQGLFKSLKRWMWWWLGVLAWSKIR
jgi:hypothetical protein